MSEGASGKASLESKRDQGGGGLAEEVTACQIVKIISWSLLTSGFLDQRPVQPLPCQEYALEGWTEE